MTIEEMNVAFELLLIYVCRMLSTESEQTVLSAGLTTVPLHTSSAFARISHRMSQLYHSNDIF